MTAVLKQWGNSIGLRLPKQIVRDAALKPGSTFTVDVEPSGALRLEPVRSRPSLETLCARITAENRHPETSWGEAAGREVW
jgi:antitoxin MazE